MTFYLEEGATSWINILDTIVDNYKNTLHESLGDHSLNQVLHDTGAQIEELHLNMDVNKMNILLHTKGRDLSVWDHV